MSEVPFIDPLSKLATRVIVAFGNKYARIYTTPLNKRATSLPKGTI